MILDITGNIIYHYALDLSSTQVPYRQFEKEDDARRKFRVSGNRNILLLCRQISFEAGHLFVNQATAYIPVTADFDISHIYDKISRGRENVLSPHQTTIMAAMTDIKDLHIHLHMQKLCQHTEHMLLFRLFEIFRHLMQPCTLTEPRWNGHNRKITVHLDHYYADSWYYHVPQIRCSINHIIARMGKMKETIWTLAYYVHTGHDEGWVPSPSYQQVRTNEFIMLKRLCDGFDNITIRPEVRGVGRWEKLVWPENCTFANLATTDCTPTNALWEKLDDKYHGPDCLHERHFLQDRRSEAVRGS